MLVSALDFHVDIKPKGLFTIGGLSVTETMFSTFVVIAAVLIFAAVIRIFFIPKWRNEYVKKSWFRIILESVASMTEKEAVENTHHYANATGGVYFGAMVFTFFGILVELIGLRSPLTDLNCTLAMGISTFLIIHFLGFKEKKAKRLLHFAPIIPLITDIVVPFSMALRLFGSVFSGFIIMHLIYALPYPIGYPAVGYVIFTLFHALIQSYVFMFLSLSFINEAIE